MTTRRSFLGAMFALAAAPAIVRADSLMRIVPDSPLILWGDGVHDDAQALNAFIQGGSVRRPDGSVLRGEPLRAEPLHIPIGAYAISSSIVFASNVIMRDSMLIARPELTGAMLYVPDGVSGSSVYNCVLEGNGKSAAIGATRRKH